MPDEPHTGGHARAAPPGPTRGFTLFEIMIAVAVVAIGLSAAFGGLSQIATNASRIQEKTLASWIAQNQITELRLQPTLPEVGESDGDVEFGRQRWVWEAEVIATQVDALRRVEVRVRYEDDERILATAVGFVGAPSTVGGQPTPWATPAGGIPGLGTPGGLPGGDPRGVPGSNPLDGVLPGAPPQPRGGPDS